MEIRIEPALTRLLEDLKTCMVCSAQQGAWHIASASSQLISVVVVDRAERELT